MFLFISLQFGVNESRSLISEFNRMIRFELSCILDEADNEQDAAEVKWSLNNLIAAYNARLEVEERIREHHE